MKQIEQIRDALHMAKSWTPGGVALSNHFGGVQCQMTAALTALDELEAILARLAEEAHQAAQQSILTKLREPGSVGKVGAAIEKYLDDFMLEQGQLPTAAQAAINAIETIIKGDA